MARALALMERPLIVFLAQYEPFPPPLFGGQLRMEHLMRELLKSYRIIFACVSKTESAVLKRDWPLASQLEDVITAPADTDEPHQHPQWGGVTAVLRALKPSPIPAIFRYRWSTKLVRLMSDAMRVQKVHAVWAYHGWMGEMGLAAGHAPVIIDTDDFAGAMMLDRLRKEPKFNRWPLFWIAARRLIRYEHQLPKRYSAVVVTKAADLKLLGDGGTTVRRVVPNGTQIPDAVGSPTIRSRLLFVGSLAYAPNSEGMCWFLRDVFPLVRERVPAVKLTIAGRGPASEELIRLAAREDVDVSISPAEIRPFYQQASVVVAPLFEGGGTSIKILEALANEVPIVATSVAARGLDLIDEQHILQADEPSEFADRCVRLLNDQALSERLVREGRQHVEANFSWASVGPIARDVVATVIEKSNAR